CVDEKLVRIDRTPSHLRDFADIDVAPVEVGVEQAQAVGAARELFERRGPAKNEHLARDLRGRYPDLLAAEQIVLSLTYRLGLQLERVETDIRLGDSKTGLVTARHQRRQHSFLLLIVAEHHNRVQAKDIHMQT